MVDQASKHYDPTELEKRIQDYWETYDTYHLVKQSREGGEDYYFVDGPPYTTGHIHLGTAWNKILKDTQLRYLRSMGYNVRDQAGFDMHGLPIEVKVEQELGIGNKKAIEELGIDRFIRTCRDFALRFQEQMAEQFKSLGVWMDWDNPYLTIMNYYIQGAWWTLHQAHRKGLLYTAERVLSWCPRCETALAEAEVEYWDETDPSIYVKFPVEGRENEFIVIWTTTPWTLMANLAVAVSDEYDYVRMLVTKDGRSEVLIVMDTLAEYVARQGRYQDMEILETIPGGDLEGLRYLHPFARIVPFQHRTDLHWMHRVVLADYVTASEENNTGCVHTAPGHGPDDFETGKRYDLPPFCPIDGAGRYTDEVPPYAGRFTKDADQDIIRDLEDRGLLLNSHELTHRYGHCWRCRKPITYLTTTQWFLRVTEVRERLLEENAKVHWTPEWAGSNRFRSWLENTRDWCISRQRYWGIPLPVWKCGSPACGNIRVVANAEELVQGNGYREGMDLHRPWIDEVTFKCTCGSEMRRVSDVLDVWFDSAVCSWAQLHYPLREDEFERWWPVQWITEAQDQTRGWFYSQLGASVIAFDRAPYERVLMHGWALDENGRPMSKSAGNVVKPSEVGERYGIDSLRFYLLRASAPWEDLSFSMEGARIANRTLTILWNVYYFSTTYMALDSYDPEEHTPESMASALTPEDRWLLSRLEQTVLTYNREFRVHNLHRACRCMEDFILEDLSRWYVKLVRDRTWSEENLSPGSSPALPSDSPPPTSSDSLPSGSSSDYPPPTSSDSPLSTTHSPPDTTSPSSPDTTSPSQSPAPPSSATRDKEAAYFTLHRSLVTVARVLSPIVPHLSEEIYLNLTGGDSVSLEPWREAEEMHIDMDLESRMNAVRQIVDAVASMRQKAGVKLRWPLSELLVETDDQTVAAAVDALQEVLLTQCNIKKVTTLGKWDGMEISVSPDYRALGPAFRGEAREAALFIESRDQTGLMADISAGTVEYHGIPLTMDMLVINERVPDTHITGEFPSGRLFLNIVLTPELEAEAFGREVIRRIQEMRKEANLRVEERIRTSLEAPEELRHRIGPWMGHIAEETRSDELAFREPSGHTRDWTIEEHRVRIGIQRITT